MVQSQSDRTYSVAVGNDALQPTWTSFSVNFMNACWQTSGLSSTHVGSLG